MGTRSNLYPQYVLNKNKKNITICFPAMKNSSIFHGRIACYHNAMGSTSTITKTRPCDIQRFFKAIKILNNFQLILFYYFYIFAQNIYCKPQFYYIKVECTGVFIAHTCFRDGRWFLWSFISNHFNSLVYKPQVRFYPRLRT